MILTRKTLLTTFDMKQVLVDHGRLVYLDEQELLYQARETVKGLRQRSGVKVRRV